MRNHYRLPALCLLRWWGKGIPGHRDYWALFYSSHGVSEKNHLILVLFSTLTILSPIYSCVISDRPSPSHYKLFCQPPHYFPPSFQSGPSPSEIMNEVIFQGQNSSGYWEQRQVFPYRSYDSPMPVNGPSCWRKALPLWAYWRWEFVCLLALGFLFCLTYCVTSWKSEVAISNGKRGVQPALLPYYIPLVGHAISYLSNSALLASRIT